MTRLAILTCIISATLAANCGAQSSSAGPGSLKRIRLMSGTSASGGITLPPATVGQCGVGCAEGCMSCDTRSSKLRFWDRLFHNRTCERPVCSPVCLPNYGYNPECWRPFPPICNPCPPVIPLPAISPIPPSPMPATTQAVPAATTRTGRRVPALRPVQVTGPPNPLIRVTSSVGRGTSTSKGQVAIKDLKPVTGRR